jgi:alkylhydroperoxidase family enzyme
MARIPGAEPSKQSFLSGGFTRIVYALTKRKLGRVVTPVTVTAHHPQILWGYGQMEQSLLSSHRLDTGLKDLASLRVATLIGCPF